MVAKSTKSQASRYSIKHPVEKISWSEFEFLCYQLAEDIKSKWYVLQHSVDSIYGVPRGGLVVAVALSHILRLPLVMEPTHKSLIVDDVADTGEALKPFKHHVTAVLHLKPWAKITPSFVACVTEGWLYYPWETSDVQKKDYTHG